MDNYVIKDGVGTGISAINGMVKTGVVSALIAGSAALYASNPVVKEAKPNQTEVVSKAGAEALKVTSLQEVNQTSIPTVHNTKLDNTLRKFAKNEDEKKAVNDILSSIYKKHGTFLSSVLLQHEIDRQNLKAFLDCNNDLLIENNINPELGKEIKGYGEEFSKTIKPNADEMTDWMKDDYTPTIYSFLRFEKTPNADEVIKKLDHIAAKNAGFDLREQVRYFESSDVYKQKALKERTDTQAKSDLAAYKMFLIDKLIMKETLKNVGVFAFNGFYLKEKKMDLTHFYEKWMDSVKPKAD